MNTEVEALVLGFDCAFVVKDLAQQLLKTEIAWEAMIESRTVFNVVDQNGKRQNVVYR